MREIPNGGFINVFAVPFCVKMFNLLVNGEHRSIGKAEKIQIMLNKVFPCGGEDNKRYIGATKMVASLVTGIDMGPPRKPYLLPDAQFEHHFRLYLPTLYKYLNFEELSKLKDFEYAPRITH